MINKYCFPAVQFNIYLYLYYSTGVLIHLCKAVHIIAADNENRKRPRVMRLRWRLLVIYNTYILFSYHYFLTIPRAMIIRYKITLRTYLIIYYICNVCVCSNLHAVYIILYNNIRNNAFLYLSQGVGWTKTLCVEQKNKKK